MASSRTYGARRVWHDVLADSGICGLHRVERLMRAQALRARPRRRGLPADTRGRTADAVAAVLGPFSRQIVGWSMRDTMTTQLVTDALLIADNGVTCSMSHSGNVWANAVMESFVSSLNTERVARKVYRTKDHARADMFDYVERFYDPAEDTPALAMSALWNSSGSQRRLKVSVHQTG